MANVNFISSRRAERVRLAKVARWLFMGTMACSLAAVFAIGWNFLQIMGVDSDIKTAESDVDKLRPQIERVKADQAARDELQPYITTLSEAQTSTRQWLGIMSSLKLAVPQETWLTNVQSERSGEVVSALRINGQTANAARVGETMLRLNAQPAYYTGVVLVSARQRQNEEPARMDFQLAVQLQQPKGSETTEGADAKAK